MTSNTLALDSLRSGSTDPAIELSGVSKRFGAVTAVDSVDLEVRCGELFGLIGHNGAGKSTLFKLMLGLILASAGTITVAGAAVSGPDFRAARRQIGYLPENLVLYDNLSGLETLRFFARLKGAEAASCPALLDRVGLGSSGAKPVRDYSKGMRQRLGFAQALLGRPRVLFLDEPSNGLDPSAIRDFYAVLQELRAQGVTVLITSHILAELQQRVDRLAIMANGRIQALGSVQALREQQDLPLTFSLRIDPSSLPALRASLQAMPALRMTGKSDGAGELELQCPRAQKMALLAVLAGRVLDLQIREPSLEDLFFELKAAA